MKPVSEQEWVVHEETATVQRDGRTLVIVHVTPGHPREEEARLAKAIAALPKALAGYRRIAAQQCQYVMPCDEVKGRPVRRWTCAARDVLRDAGEAP